MNLGELKTHVKRQFGDESSVQVTDDDIVRWVTLAQEEIVRENEEILNVISKIDLVAGQDEYAFPEDALTLRSIRAKSNINDPGYEPIIFMTNAQFERSVAGYENIMSNFAASYLWTTYNRVIYLFPIPKGDVTEGLRISYSQQPTVPTNDVDPLGLSLEYHNSILQYCLVMAYEMDENWEGAGNKMAQLQANLNRRANRSQSEARETYPVLTIRPEDE